MTGGVIDAPEGEAPEVDRRGGATWVAALSAAVVVPLVVATVALRRPPWSPVLDLAMTELRVRDVGTAHTPLIGLPGRIGDAGTQGSHPGPLSFWLLAPTYRALGSTAWGLHVGSFVLDTAAIALAVWLGDRIGGRRLAAWIAVLLALLVVGYGLGPILEPWNPYLPLLWWVVFLLSLWASLLGDRPALVVLVVSGSLCAQTHIPYLALCLGLGAVAVMGLAHDLRRHPERRRRALRWGLAAVGVGVLLWIPPTIDQAINEPGNYRILIEHFATPPEAPVGLREASGQVFEHLDLGHLVVDQVRHPGRLTRGQLGTFPVAWRGAVLLVAWVAMAAAAWSKSPRSLRALHVVVGASTLLGWYSISRVFGLLWFYLMLWLWAVALLMVIALVWSVVAWRGASGGSRAGPRTWTLALPLVLILLLGIRSLVEAPGAEASDNELSLSLNALVAPTTRALDDGVGAATGRDGRYLVSFDDPLHIGSQAYGLVTELERAGFEVGMDVPFAVPITEHRKLRPEEATARVELVTGIQRDAWVDKPGVVEVAMVDLRSPDELAELEQLRADVTDQLEAEGLDDLIPLLDTNLFLAAIDGRASEPLRVKMNRMLKIGTPTSVFIAPIDARP